MSTFDHCEVCGKTTLRDICSGECKECGDVKVLPEVKEKKYKWTCERM